MHADERHSALEARNAESRLILRRIRRDLDARTLDPRRLRAQLDELDARASVTAALLAGWTPAERRSAPLSGEPGFPLLAMIEGGRR